MIGGDESGNELLEPETPDRPRATLPARYGLELDVESIPGLLARHGLRFAART
ncbi:MAG: hypothetical protein QOJ35_132 [Solirubrobacteraceae bacterium]|jgi:hypothetical protein|nr:hypothetical protein [Solirubrobacteraceae bacterium]